jgi:hypothetical protein
MAILTRMAFSEFNTLESMDTPCPVKSNGAYFGCWPLFKDANCDLREMNKPGYGFRLN